MAILLWLNSGTILGRSIADEGGGGLRPHEGQESLCSGGLAGFVKGSGRGIDVVLDKDVHLHIQVHTYRYMYIYLYRYV